MDNLDTIFLISLNKILSKEGFINNNPKDKGGYTYKGISRAKHPSWKGWRIIDSVLISLSVAPRDIKKRVKLDEVFNSNLPLNRLVEDFYRTEFWNKIQGDLLPSQLIADELFDTSVNLGVSAASEILQHTINLLNKNGTIYPDIIVDGIIGNQTLTILNKCIAANGEKLIFNLLNIYQAKKYIEIMERDHSQEIFIGWFTRIEITKC
ncbi:MAG: glycoside hydrolase family 108 protein [Ignavibacteriaceae bacterium]